MCVCVCVCVCVCLNGKSCRLHTNRSLRRDAKTFHFTNSVNFSIKNLFAGDCQRSSRFGRHLRLSRQPHRRGHDRHGHPPLVEDPLQLEPRPHHRLQGPDGLYR